MKWIFYVIVFVYMFYRAVYGIKPVDKLVVDPINYGEDGFLKVGDHATISCQATDKSKVEWLDPKGDPVRRSPGGRVFAQDHFVQKPFRGRIPALVLTFTKTLVRDTGVYSCRLGEHVKNVSLCVIDPSEFIDTPTEMTTDVGRSITLTCQAKGQPEPRLTWKRNNETISDEESTTKYRIMTKYNMQGFESLLTVSSLSPEDSGVYSCVSVQESLQNDDCIHTNTMNMTLNVNYAPKFDVDNGTYVNVYGRNNELVKITCAAQGYPAPTYKMFTEIDEKTLREIDKKQIEISEEDNSAVANVPAGTDTYGRVVKCVATNDYGQAEKYFTIQKIEKPSKPGEVKVSDAVHNILWLNVIWSGEMYPVDEMTIQCMQARNKKVPNERDWLSSMHLSKTPFELVKEGIPSEGLFVTLDGLEEDTTYWFRVRAKNGVGISPWSSPIRGSTTIEMTTTTETPESMDSQEEGSGDEVSNGEASPSSAEDNMNETTFYGIFFAGGILVVAFVCMFAMRMVK